MKRYFKYIYFLPLLLSLSSLSAQEVLFSENFNECMVPPGWATNISYGDGVGFYVGQPTNDNSDSTSIDGTCMMVFDDDILGNNTPSFIAEVSTPSFQTKGYNTVRLNTDISFRAYGTSTLSVYVEEADGNRILVAEYGENQQTGSQFSDFVPFSIDITFFTKSEALKLVYIYDDMEMYAWYGGIDNVEVIGSGEGEIVLIEQFNDCAVPEGWSTNVLEGNQDWVLGYFDNNNSSATSMNGSCFAFFDDDKIGRDAPFSTADLMTPWFDGTQYATFFLEMELIFRRYGDFENISVFVNDGNKMTLVKEFFDAVAGPQINNFEAITLDLTEYRSNDMQVIFRYDDGNEWGWWTGLDNVKIIGNGTINDLCDKAELLEVGKACISSKNKNAVFSGPPNSCYSNGEGSLWYRFEAPDAGILKLSNQADYNDLITVFSGPCDDLVEMYCSNFDEHGFRGEEVVFNVTKDQSYFIRISGIDSAYGLSRGRNCIKAEYINTVPLPSAEDVLEMAVALPIDGIAQPIDNRHANIESMLPEDNLLARSDLWYSFSTEEYQNIQVNVSSSFAENTTVYDADLNEIHTQVEGGNFQLHALQPNQTFFIQVSGTFAIIEGSADISLKAFEAVEPEFDDCASSTKLFVDEVIQYNTNAQTFSGIYPSCDIFVNKDRWYKFTTDGNLVYLNIESDFITNFAIYTGDCDDLEEIMCLSGVVSCDGSIPLGGLAANTAYYLQLSTSETNNNKVGSMMEFSLSYDPVEQSEVSVIVSTVCQENGQAELEVVIEADVPYTMEGNVDGDLLFEGDAYIVVVTPEVGCEKSIKGIVECQPTTCILEIEPIISYPTCHGGQDGSILLEVENGLGPYSYEWSHSEEDVSEFPSVGEGVFQVTVTDALGCISATEIVIEQPSELTSIVSSTDQMLAGMADGTASVEVSGGTLPYSFAWSNLAIDSSIEGLIPGNYAVTVSDYNGCTTTHDIIISELDCAFTVDVELTPVTCHEGNDGSLTISSSESIQSVEWVHGASGTMISDVTAGNYTATITLENGCQKIEMFTIDQPEPISFQEEIGHVKCFGETNGTIDVSVSGGNGNFVYTWNQGANTALLQNIPAGSYTLIATDENGCSAEKVFEIVEPELLEVASTMVTDLSCADSQDGQICVFVQGGTLPYQFDWVGLENGMSKMTDLVAGTYNLMVTDSNSCTLTTEQVVSAPDPITASLEDISITEDGNGQISILVEGGVEPYEITWYMNDEVVGAGSEINNLMEGIYRAVIIDGNGCIFETGDYLLYPTSVGEVAASKFSVFPNPARSLFNISGEPIDKDLQCKVFTSDGQDVSGFVDFEKRSEVWVGENVQLNSGLYFIELSNGLETVSLPLVILGD